MFLILSFNINSLNTATLKLYNNKQIKNNVKLAQRKKKDMIDFLHIYLTR